MYELKDGIDLTEETRKHTGKCVDCDSPLELYELNFEKHRKVLRCQRCGLFHLFKRDFFGKWKLVKAAKVSKMWDK